jgi:hypothetical protein
MRKYVALLLICMLQARPGRSFEDPISNGNKYLMSSENPGQVYYLGCGDDMKCSMVPLVGAQEHDGWTAVEISGASWQFLIRDGSWALDVRDTTQTFSQTTGNEIYGNPNVDTQLTSQLWTLEDQSDGTYQLDSMWKSPGALDVDITDNLYTPFANGKVGSDLSGQYWYFRSVYPQTTLTSTSTSVVTVNSYAGSTVTVTTTICPNKVRTHTPLPFPPPHFASLNS